MTKRHFFLGILVFLLFAVTNVAFGQQTVYWLSDARKLPVIKGVVEARRTQGMPWAQIVGDLIAHNHIQEITPQLAQETLRINWLEGGDGLGNLPNLLVVNTGQGVGYGLFTMDGIEPNTIVTEYTGVVITDEAVFQENPYTLDVRAADDFEDKEFRQIDALHAGNAGRFAQHFPSENELPKYQFNVNPSNGVATANIRIVREGLLRRMFLVANRRIEPFEQIGWNYGPRYEWQQQPRLFDMVGNIIPIQTYTPPRTILFESANFTLSAAYTVCQSVFDGMFAASNRRITLPLGNGLRFRFDPEELRRVVGEHQNMWTIHLPGKFFQ